MAQRKTVIVTGAGTGIGRATALRFAQDGYNVVLNGRSRPALDEVAAEIGEAVLVAPGNVANRDEVDQVIDATVAKFGGIELV